MRISKIEAIPIRCELGRAYRSTRMRRRHRDVVVTRIRTDAGGEGYCFNAVSGTSPMDVANVILEEIAPAIVGVDLFAVEEVVKRGYRATYRYQRDLRISARARACVDSAQWDAIGRAVGQPLHRLWGGHSDPLPVIVWGGLVEEDRSLVDYGHEMERIRKFGAMGCKFKVGYLSPFSPEQDAERIGVARQAAGPDFLLIADANQGWTAREAIEFGRRVEDLNLLWIEEPCRWPNDRREMAHVRAVTGIPIAAGQVEVSAESCRDMMIDGAIDVCNFDATWGGGPTIWRRVAAMAACFGLRMTQHQEAQFAGHMIASVPDAGPLELYPPDLDPPYFEMFLNRPQLKDGYCALPEGPGWGMELDWSYVEKHRLG
ncbi:MAG TPA: mandelate racemase/muconate lactonizing enzyme family protein [Hyphomicrobiaceae bacterium]|jgi:D-arabinonate dehydratase|nr:mandelate racemase/muconate lactonizing enzyme family protein [Hyphomicrobiaceae bacterium]